MNRVARVGGWVAALGAAFTIGCDGEAELPGTPAPTETIEAAPNDPGLTTLPADRDLVGEGRRTEMQMRLWIGLWCAPGAPADADPFRLVIDGVEMLRVDSACGPRETDPPRGPNGGSIAFTLSRGGHALSVHRPDGQVSTTRLGVLDDTWVGVEHTVDPSTGEVTVAFEVDDRFRAWDAAYDPSTRPGASDDDTPRDERTVPTADDGDGSASDGEWETAGEAPPTRGRAASRRRGPDGHWIEGTPGFLRVRSVIEADVYVDGDPVRQATPTTDIAVSAGTHRVELRAEGFHREFRVTVDEGEVRTLMNDRRE